jgi:hypothetical protein
VRRDLHLCNTSAAVAENTAICRISCGSALVESLAPQVGAVEREQIDATLSLALSPKKGTKKSH